MNDQRLLQHLTCTAYRLPGGSAGCWSELPVQYTFTNIGRLPSHLLLNWPPFLRRCLWSIASSVTTLVPCTGRESSFAGSEPLPSHTHGHRAGHSGPQVGKNGGKKCKQVMPADGLNVLNWWLNISQTSNPNKMENEWTSIRLQNAAMGMKL